jgi:aspartyl aminopeptidase
MNKKNLWTGYTDKEKKEIEQISSEYKEFLDKGKTEREVVEITLEILLKNGFKNIEKAKTLKPGDKVFYNNRNKNILISIIGKEDMKKGINIIASHVDSPRLDLKMNPLLEEQEFLMLNTHYYGGIKKYQWVATPLAVHGIVFLKNGKKVSFAIGEKDDDPVFCIPDILPHLSRNVQDDRKAREVIKGEELKVLFGSVPVEDENTKEKIKENILIHLKKEYGISEDDFFSAEIEVVPAVKARDIGLDRGMIGAYGQDDRICAYTSLKALLDIKKPERTVLCYFADKEEVGSSGSTGLNSSLIEYYTGKLLKLTEKNYDDQMLREVLWNSRALSADVTAGVDAVFKSVHDLNNAARLSHGVSVAKYTGHGGKSNSNDADAEYMFEIREVFDKNKVGYQIGGFGKVDEGGGGTVAKFLAYFGIKTVDIGPALLSMHSLFEVSSKADIYEAYKAYKAFYSMK